MRLTLSTLSLVTSIGCGSTSSLGPADGGTSFGPSPFQVVYTTPSGWKVNAFSSPSRPSKGTTAWKLAVYQDAQDPASEPVTTATLTFKPIMPAHGHGAAGQPIISTQPEGYIVQNVNLYMSGRWELRLSFQEAERFETAMVSVDIP